MPSGLNSRLPLTPTWPARSQNFSQVLKLRRHFGFVAHNSDIVLHRLLEDRVVAYRGFRPCFAQMGAMLTGDVLNFIAIDIAELIFLRKLGGRTHPRVFPKTKRSDKEFPPSRFAPLIPAAHSPAANSPGKRDICVSESNPNAPIIVMGGGPTSIGCSVISIFSELFELVIHCSAVSF